MKCQALLTILLFTLMFGCVQENIHGTLEANWHHNSATEKMASELEIILEVAEKLRLHNDIITCELPYSYWTALDLAQEEAEILAVSYQGFTKEIQLDRMLTAHQQLRQAINDVNYQCSE